MVTLTILGCGTSTGVPIIGCRCSVCHSKNKKNQRLRASAWIKTRGKNILIDTSIDFRQQALKYQIPRVDAVLFTHPHADHISGIDELRSYNFFQKTAIPVYGNDWTCRDLTKRFPYIFNRDPDKQQGGGIALLKLNSLDTQAPCLELEGIPIIPISLHHGTQESVGYRIESIAYITDCSYIPTSSLDRLRELSVLVLDCVRIRPHATHLNIDQALEVVTQIRPEKTYLTHLGHDFDYVKWRKKLPRGVELAYDGLTIKRGK